MRLSAAKTLQPFYCLLVMGWADQFKYVKLLVEVELTRFYM